MNGIWRGFETSWSNLTPTTGPLATAQFTSIASDATGSHLTVAAGSDIYVTTDTGATWTDESTVNQVTNNGGQGWGTFASNADGSVVLACDDSGIGELYLWSGTDAAHPQILQGEAGATLTVVYIGNSQFYVLSKTGTWTILTEH